MPSREMKPTMSVMVVKITPPARAGSILSLDKISGRLTPLIAPIIKFIIRAEAITIPRKILLNQR